MWIAIVLFLVILGILAYLDTRKPKNFPPGPKWLPLVGSALSVFKERKRAGGYMYACSAEMAKTYGPVTGLKIGRDMLVIVYGKQAIREFLTSDDLIGRPQGPFYEMRTWGKRRGVMFTDSDFWQEQRRFVIRELREFGFGRKNMSGMIEDEAASMIDNLRGMGNNNDGESVVIHLETVFNIHIFNTMWMMLAGIRHNPEDKNLKQLQQILSDLFHCIDVFGAPFSQYPILRFIAPELSGYSLYVKTHFKLWDFLNDELRRHKETHTPDVSRDFMDVYLNMLNSPNKRNTFSEDQLLALCLDLFMAGSETTSKTLSFCFLYLVLYPEAQRKAQKEIDRVVGRNRLPCLDDRPNMPYMECVVLESLRLFAGRALTLPHRAVRDTHLNGYYIPKDVTVVANLNSALMGPESGYENPEVFDPDRHMKDGKVTVTDMFIPFGMGKRRCMGDTQAKANVFLFAASLLQNFTFSVPPGCAPSVELIDGITPGLKHVKALCTPRLFYK